MPNNMKILSEELKKYTKPTHLVDFTLGTDQSGNPTFASASENAETIDGWLQTEDNVVYRIQYGQNAYVYGTTTDHFTGIDSYIKFAAFLHTAEGWFGPSGVYRLEARWDKTSGTWNALPTIASVIPMENDYSPDAIAQPFSTSSTYAVGDVVMYEGLRYRCTTAVSTAGAWNPSNWTSENVQGAFNTLKAKDVVVVTGEIGNNYSTITNLSHSFAQVAALVSAKTPVMMVVRDPHSTIARFTAYHLAYAGYNTEEDTELYKLVFSSIPDQDWEGLYFITWSSSDIRRNWTQFATWDSEKINTISPDVDASTDPITLSSSWCWSQVLDHSSSLQILRLEINNSLIISLQAITAELDDNGYPTKVVFGGTISDAENDEASLVVITLEPPDDGEDDDKWSVSVIPLSNVYHVSATLNTSTMEISNADRSLQEILGAASQRTPVFLTLSDVFHGWMVSHSSDSLLFTVLLMTNLGEGTSPYMVQAELSNSDMSDYNEANDTWTTTVVKLAMASEVPTITMRVYDED